MKRFALLSIVCVILFLPACATVAADTTGKIGVIDIQKIMMDSAATQKARSVFMKDVEQKRAQLITRDREIKEMDRELKEQNAKLSDETRREKAEELAREVKEFRRLDADLTEELKKKDVELTRKILGEIRQIAQTYLKKMKYTLILEKNAVFASDDAIDVTDNIIKMYDAQEK